MPDALSSMRMTEGEIPLLADRVPRVGVGELLAQDVKEIEVRAL